MKLVKLITCGLVGLALLSSAQAQTRLYISGSTAFRSSTHAAIKHIFNGSSLQFAFIDNANGDATESNSGAAIYTGKVLIGAVLQDVIIKTHWSGSENGIQVAAAPASNTDFSITFFDDNTTVSQGGTKIPFGTALTDIQNDVDVAMSDTFQATSRFKAGSSGNGLSAGTYLALNGHTVGLPAGNIVGIVPFKFVASNDAPSSVTNMTSQIARALFSTGKVPLSMFTGTAAGHSVHAFAIGRDIDSGTRLTTLAETGLGALAVVKQYEPHKNGARAATPTGDGFDVDPLTTLWPPETVNHVPEVTGNGGYASGGGVAAAIANHTAAGQFMMSYLGASDAATAVGNGAHELTFNGTSFDANAIAEGDYTFWGYEHLYYNTTKVPAGTKRQLADKLALQIFNTDAPAPHYGDMSVTRKTDGAVVLPIF